METGSKERKAMNTTPCAIDQSAAFPVGDEERIDTATIGSLFSSTTSIAACTRYWNCRSASFWGLTVRRYKGKFCNDNMGFRGQVSTSRPATVLTCLEITATQTTAICGVL